MYYTKDTGHADNQWACLQWAWLHEKMNNNTVLFPFQRSKAYQMFPLHGSGHTYSCGSVVFLLPDWSGCRLPCPEPDSVSEIFELLSCVGVLLELGGVVALNAVPLFAASSALRRSTPAPTHAQCSPRVTSKILMHTRAIMVLLCSYSRKTQFKLLATV